MFLEPTDQMPVNEAAAAALSNPEVFREQVIQIHALMTRSVHSVLDAATSDGCITVHVLCLWEKIVVDHSRRFGVGETSDTTDLHPGGADNG